MNIKSFFDFINFNDCEEILSTYRSQSVISLLYSSEEKINCELGMLNYSKINNYKFVYITVPLVSILGSPIITLNTHKIIGIISDNGKFLINIIQDFFEICNKKEEKIDEITLIYKILDERNIQLFGKKFIENNKDKCKMIINGKEKNLEE